MSAIEEIRRHRLPLEVNYTVLHSTIDDVAAMIDLAESLGAGRLNMHWFSLVGRARTHASDEVISALDWRNKVLEVVRRYRSPRPDFAVDCELGYAYGYPAEGRDQCAVCSTARPRRSRAGAVRAWCARTS